MAEAFNVFNQENFTINAQENNAHLKAIQVRTGRCSSGSKVAF
jgi:hypothetical protein